MGLDIELFRADKGGNPDLIRESQRRRGKPVELVDEVIRIDTEWRKVVTDIGLSREKLNALNKKIGELKKNKQDVAASMFEEQKALKEQIAALEAKEKEVIVIRDQKKDSIGNLVHDSVPVSNNEDNNRIEKIHGKISRPEGYQGHPHHVLLHMIGGVDMTRGSKVAGHRGYFLQGPGLFLHLALQQYGLRFLTKRGFLPMSTPYFMKKDVMAATAQLSQFDEELYHVTKKSSKEEEEEFYLIATSEQPISAYHLDEWIEPKSLPIRYAGTSACFRKEAGGAGRDVWGIFRVHQFEKVEQFCITSPEDNESWKMHEEMIKNCEDFYQSLGLSYRLITIVSGALNDAAAKKIDLEAFFPSYNECRELVSCSNCTDYQARSMNTRFRGSVDKQQYVHMLNCTLTATSRTLSCLLENYETPKGIKVPDVLKELVPYPPDENGDIIIPFVNAPPVLEEPKAKGKGKK